MKLLVHHGTQLNKKEKPNNPECFAVSGKTFNPLISNLKTKKNYKTRAPYHWQPLTRSNAINYCHLLKWKMKRSKQEMDGDGIFPVRNMSVLLNLACNMKNIVNITESRFAFKRLLISK